MEYAKDYSGENFLHQKDLILSEWEKRLRIEFSDFGKLPQSVLRNSIPEFLERISKSLVDKNSKK